MKKVLFISLFIFILIPYNNCFPQSKKSGATRLMDNFKVVHYLVRDSLNSYLIKEVIYPDGTKVYSLIPKSHIDENIDAIKDNFPSTLIEWFNREKYSGGISSVKTEMGLIRTSGKIDTVVAPRFERSSSKRKPVNLWWILAPTALVGGAAAYYFIHIKNALEELPIQPNSPK